MDFKTVSSDIAKMIELELKAINESTGSLRIVSLDLNSRKYVVIPSGSSGSITRTLGELETIWLELLEKNLVNVEQSLAGSGSSRNHPETILANLPYVEYCKLNKKKHLVLRANATHPLGSIKKLGDEEFQKLEAQVQKAKNFSLRNHAFEQANAFSGALDAAARIGKKLGRDTDFSVLLDMLDKIQKRNDLLVESLVNIDDNKEFSVSPPESIKSDLHGSIYDQSADADEVDNEDDESDSTNMGGRADIWATVKIRQVNPTLALLCDRIKYDEIDLQPEFQRKDRIWSLQNKARLIESLLMGFPLPSFYFGERKSGNWIVVDGLQRLTTVYDFLNDRFALNGLELKHEYNEKKYSDLSRQDHRRLREYEITGHIIEMRDDQSDAQVVEIFRRINTYGVQLSAQEIRSALRQGSSVRFLRYVAESDMFKHVTRGRVKADRMGDMELCLRAIAFLVLGYTQFEYKTFNEFLLAAMARLNQFKFVPSDSLKKTGKDVSEAAGEIDPIYDELLLKLENGWKLAIEIFDKSCFEKSRTEKGAPINKALFEVITTVFAKIGPDDARTLIDRRNDFVAGFYGMIDDPKKSYASWGSEVYQQANRGFDYSITQSTGKKVTVLYRFNSVVQFLEVEFGVKVDDSSMVSF